jgi:hypothetical protein
MREADLQRTILDYLRMHRIFHWRNNTGAVAASYKGKARFFRFGAPGSPDIFAVTTQHSGCCCQLFGIELKGPNGKQTARQREFEIGFTQAGGKYVLARRIEDVQEALR